MNGVEEMSETTVPLAVPRESLNLLCPSFTRYITASERKLRRCDEFSALYWSFRPLAVACVFGCVRLLLPEHAGVVTCLFHSCRRV